MFGSAIHFVIYNKSTGPLDDIAGYCSREVEKLEWMPHFQSYWMLIWRKLWGGLVKLNTLSNRDIGQLPFFNLVKVMDAMIDMASMTKINAVSRVDGKVYFMGAYVLWYLYVGARISESDDKIVVEGESLSLLFSLFLTSL